MRFKNLLNKKFYILLVGSCVFLLAFFSFKSSFAASQEVQIIQLDGDTINPVTAQYIMSAIDNATREGAHCLIIKLDTPGGLLTSTRSIVKKMMSAKIPIIVYIAPGGARAGSAGVFITYASHVAAMAPSTNIGAAHPVQLGQQKQRNIWDTVKDTLDSARNKDQKEVVQKDIESDEDPMTSKILQDTVAFIKAITKERNRNSEWAELAVTKSLSVTETEALEKGIVDVIAKDEYELLEKIDGRIITIDEKRIVLDTKNAFVKKIEMNMRQRILNVLANPNIAYIFMILGFYGLLYEVTHPGIGVPGVMGSIFLILAFFSLQTLPTNYAGLALIILGLVLFVAEAMVPGFGLLTLGGLVCMILGSLLLFDSPQPFMRVSLSIILPFSLGTAGITVFLVKLVLSSQKKKVLSGKEGLVCETGNARTKITPKKKGKVFVHGEIWNAVSDEDIQKDDPISVEEIKGLTLKVRKEQV